MEKQAILSIGLRIVSHLILFILFVRFYLIGEMGDYMADRVTTTSRFEEVSELEFPTITICMDPPQKPSVALMYGFDTMFDIIWEDVPNTTLYERFETSSYILNKDFSIKVKAFNKKEIALLVGDNDNCYVAPIVTIYHGICYKIDPKFKIPEFNSVLFKLYLNEMNTEKPINLVMYLTSPDATLNLATDIWPQFLPGEIKLPFDATRKKTVISYRNVEYTFKTGVENSKECVTEIIEKSKCKNNCFSISGSLLPICNSTKDYDCIWQYYPQWQKCLLQKRAVAYVPKKNDILYYGKKSSDIEVQFSTRTKGMQIIEEIDIITLSGLIGSIGGSLGMFFGFSITSYLSFVIERFVKKVFHKI